MKNTYTNKDGWTFDTHNSGTDLFSLPTTTIVKKEKSMIQLVHIAYSHTQTRRVYFVDVLDRNAWVTVGQFKTEIEAREAFNKLAGA